MSGITLKLYAPLPTLPLTCAQAAPALTLTLGAGLPGPKGDSGEAVDLVNALYGTDGTDGALRVEPGVILSRSPDAGHLTISIDVVALRDGGEFP